MVCSSKGSAVGDLHSAQFPYKILRPTHAGATFNIDNKDGDYFKLTTSDYPPLLAAYITTATLRTIDGVSKTISANLSAPLNNTVTNCKDALRIAGATAPHSLAASSCVAYGTSLVATIAFADKAAFDVPLIGRFLV